MAEETHIIDPCADTVLVLKNPGASFAVWCRSEIEPDRIPEKHVGGEKVEEEGWGDWWGHTAKKKKGKTGRKVKQDTEVSNLAAGPTIDPDSANGSLFGDGLSNDHEVGPSMPLSLVATEVYSPSQEEPLEATEELVQEDEGGIQYMVSSRHLALASGFFRSSLAEEGWMESHPSKVDGLYHLTASEWDPEAFLILFNILHLRNYQVPRTITLEMLARIAVLVDYYRCAEAVTIFFDLWCDTIKKTSPIPSTYNRELVLWMCVAWVFEMPVEFEKVTKIAIRHIDTPSIDDMFLPIPKVVLDAIEQRRYQAIESVMSCLHGWLEKFRGTSFICARGQNDLTCSSVLFGALAKQMDGLGYLSPRPEVPFQGLSFEELYKSVYAMSSPSWCEYNRYNGLHPCNLHNTVNTSVDQIKGSLTGLTLDEFKDCTSGA